jgi:hypothetical protein
MFLKMAGPGLAVVSRRWSKLFNNSTISLRLAGGSGNQNVGMQLQLQTLGRVGSARVVARPFSLLSPAWLLATVERSSSVTSRIDGPLVDLPTGAPGKLILEPRSATVVSARHL